jgi:hypothetical protein
MKLKLNWDGVGILTSVLCALHCGLLPFVLPALPLFGINIIHNAFFEWMMIGIAITVGAYSLYHGYIRHHRSNVPIWLFTIGACFLIAKQWFTAVEYYFLVVAVVLIIAAHYRNYRMSRVHQCHSPHHKH